MARTIRETADAIYGAFTNSDFAAIDELFTDDYVEHASWPGISQDRDGIKQWLTMMKAGFPDLVFTVTDVITEGDKVAVLASCKGTNTGEFMGMPATGKAMQMTLVDYARMAPDGRCAEHWVSTDSMELMGQLGAEAQIPTQVDVTTAERQPIG